MTSADRNFAKEESQRLASLDGNILNVLQVVAKLLELWFFFIAGTLVYNLSMLLARQPDGLPLHYLDLHIKIAGSVDLLRPSFWRAPFTRKRGKGYSRKLYALLAFTVVVCAISTVLGPAIAILLLPVRGTAVIDQLPSRQFIRLHSEEPPRFTRPPGESPGNYVGKQPATFFDRANIDQLAEDLTRSSGHIYPSARAHQIPLRVDMFISNWLKDGSIWIPCRRVLDQLLSQFLRYQLLGMLPWNEGVAEMEKPFLSSFHNIRGGPEDVTGALLAADDGEKCSESLQETYKTSLDLGFRKEGPAIGLLGSCTWGNVSVLSVANGMSVRCYTFSPQDLGFPLSDSEEGLSTKCIRVGHGWSDARNDHAQFFIHRTNPLVNNVSETVSIDFYSVSSSILLNSTTRHCRMPVTTPSHSPCDWNALFAEPPQSQHRITSLNQQVVEYGYWNNTQNKDSSRPTPESSSYSAMWCNSASHLGFGTYEFGLAQRIVNATGDARLTVDTDLKTAEPLYIHPDWLLASWEVGHSETISVNMSNPAAVHVLEFLRDAATIQVRSPRVVKMSSLCVSNVHAIIMTGALTIIDYDELLLNDTALPDRRLGPVLENVLTSSMWVYDLSSRTRVLGFAVAAVGCVIVGFGVALSLAPWPFTTQPDTLSLFREALAQHSKEALGDSLFEGLGWLPYKIVPKRGTQKGEVTEEEEERGRAKSPQEDYSSSQATDAT